MEHIVDLIDSNVVIISKSFNIPIINTVWLYKNDIFTEEEMRGATCLPVTVEIRTDTFHFSLVPDRLHFSVKPDHEDPKGLILSKIGKLVKLLPHTPYIAAGLNFTFHVTPADGDLCKLSRELFFNERSKLFHGLESDDVRFGGFFSMHKIDTRLRFDAKPVTVPIQNDKEEKLQFSYNFNVTISQNDDYNKILDLFKKWEKAVEFCKEINSKINQGE